jgi:indole-3-glycerol phosphate synthase
MPEFLSRIIRTTREDLAERQRQMPLRGIRDSVRDTGRTPKSLIRAVQQPGVSLIAEYKRASPSLGDIRPDLDVASVVSSYEAAGARAVSVLTEERHFKGSLDDLREARDACGLPLLRKDFIVDPYQIWEAAAAGADAILLIVAALEPAELVRLGREADQAGLECLVEIHNGEELETALKAGVPLLGINNRDLKTFKTDLDTTLNLIKSVPNGVSVVSESGIRTRGDIARLVQAGVQGVLIGETLMRSPDPGDAVKQLLA